ncbi:MAG: hypothetical protein IJX08_01420 [Clostridia bacterium]|nr:hypothetical protein [Clostridia bacterium]
MVEKEAEKRKLARLPFELQWRLNSNFLSGNQHCDINVHRGTVENYAPLYDYMSREVFNRIAPIMETRMSQLKRVNYDLAVLPKSNEYEDQLKAKIAGKLLSSKMKSEEYRACFERVLGLCELMGSAFVLSWWDDKASALPSLEGEDANQADVAFTVLSPFEILPEELYVEGIAEQPSIILEQVKSTKELYELYGVRLEGGKVSCCGLVATDGAGGLGYEASTQALGSVLREDALILRTYMEKPSQTYPGGRFILTAGGKLLYYGALPYGGYPLCMLKSKRVSGQFFGHSVIENLIPLQRSYNGIKNRINDYINRSTCGQLLIEEGSVDAEDLTETGLVPGAPIVYSRGATLPTLLDTPELSDFACAQCEKLEQDMEYAAGVSGMLAGGNLPSSVNSALAIELLQSMDTTRLSLYAENLRLGVLELARIWLSIYRRYITDSRAIAIAGRNGRGAIVCFLGSDLNSDELYFESENELQVRREEQRARYVQALNLGLFSDENGRLSPKAKSGALRKLLGKGGEIPFCEEELQGENACNEHADFEEDLPLRVHALDDHLIHLQEHRLYALQDRFRALEEKDPERAQKLLAHIKEHGEQLKEQQKGEA